MTLSELKRLNDITITPKTAASVLGCSDQLIRIQARQEPELLGFPVIVMGTRVRIPRIPFIDFLEKGKNQ